MCAAAVSLSPRARVLAREAGLRHAAKVRDGKHTPNPWLIGAPPYGSHLPGVSMSIDLSPVPQWPIELRNTRGLHGALTAILGQGHALRLPFWSLFPSGSGWAVHWWHARGGDLANKTVVADLYGHQTRFRFGPGFRMRAPTVARRGRSCVRLDTITPLALAEDGMARLSTKGLRAMLCADWLHRLGVEYLRDKVHVEVGEADGQTVHVPIGGKYGTVPAWEGSMEINVNAPAYWLLMVGSRVGLGARTAFGFGRVRITEV